MEMDLENLSKKEFLELIKKQSKTISNQEKAISKQVKTISKQEEKSTGLESKVTGVETKAEDLQRLVDLLRRMQFGQKCERFEAPSQITLPLDVEQEILEEQEAVIKQEITYSREKKKHPGRAKLPEHLPVEEIEIYPQGDLSDKVCIGKETTDVLDYVPGYFKIKRYIRYKYATKDTENTQITIGALPDRVIDKGIPCEGLLASILVDKYVDHLPLYRQKQRFAREKIEIAS